MNRSGFRVCAAALSLCGPVSSSRLQSAELQSRGHEGEPTWEGNTGCYEPKTPVKPEEK